MSIRLKIELTRCMATGSWMYRRRPGSRWWSILHNSVRLMKISNTIYLMRCKVLHPWVLLNAIQYPGGVSKKHLTTCGKTIKATVGSMVEFDCTWWTRGMTGKQALSSRYIWSNTRAQLWKLCKIAPIWICKHYILGAHSQESVGILPLLSLASVHIQI